MSRLREGRANTALAPPTSCVRRWGRVRYGGASGDNSHAVRADSGFYAHTVDLPPAGKWMSASLSPSSARQPAGPDRGARGGLDSHSPGWTAPPMSPRRLSPRSRPSRTPRRRGFIVRRVKPTPVPSSPSSPDTAITPSSPTAMGRRWNWRPIIAVTPRSRMRYVDLKSGVGLNHLPSGRFAANGAWLAVQWRQPSLPLDGADWLVERTAITKTLRRRVCRSGGTDHPLGAPPTLHLPRRWPWETQFSRALARLQAIPLPA